MDAVTLPLTGGCLCGQVRYSLAAAPLLVYACHCHDCQRRSGSAFAMTVVVSSADLELAGQLDGVLMTNPSGRVVENSFCPTCRVRVFARAVAAMDYISLRAGTFDDTSWIVPGAQTYVESAIPWAVMDGVPNVPAAEFDFFKLGEAWRAGAPPFERRPA